MKRMKAAILHQLGTLPQYEDFAEPVPVGEEQVLINVTAASVKQLDKIKAAGKHYTSYPHLPITVGVDGVGVLEDGKRIYAMGISGMIAEKALVGRGRWTLIPDGLSDAEAAALPNALMGAAMALTYRAQIKKGDVVLVNGATGVTGSMAVQVAKYYGASWVIATGRNKNSLTRLLSMGADDIIELGSEEDVIIDKLRAAHSSTPVNIVIDYLWGKPVELILKAFQSSPSNHVKLVTVGEMAGANISLSSGILRSAQIEILGSGIGSISMEQAGQFMKQSLPEMFSLAAEGKIKIEVETMPLTEVSTAWEKEPAPGKRMVILI